MEPRHRCPQASQQRYERALPVSAFSGFTGLLAHCVHLRRCCAPAPALHCQTCHHPLTYKQPPAVNGAPRASRATSRRCFRERTGPAVNTKSWRGVLRLSQCSRAGSKGAEQATQADVCFGCHKAQRAQVRRVSAHPLATTGLADTRKMACSDCHNPHGSTGPKLLVKNSVNDTCFTCHAEKRGPYLWEHAPVADDCTNCHTPHGSSNAPLLKARVPWLCQACHSGDHAAQINSGANLAGRLSRRSTAPNRPGRPRREPSWPGAPV
jgi:predicted CXXCH cytochrome family protein